MPHMIMHLKRMNLKYLKSNIACIALVCITCIGFAQPKTVDKIIGVAGNKIILLSELEQQYAQYIAQGNYANPAMRSQIFNQLMTNKMLLYHAMLDSVEVSESQVEEQLDRRFAYFIGQFGGEKELEKYYNKSIIELKEEFRPTIKDQLLVQQMQGKVTKNSSVTPEDVRNYFESIPKDSLPLINTEVEYAQITATVAYNEESKTTCKAKLEEYRQRVLKGEDFGALAVLYSLDKGSAKNSGELGFMNRGDLVPEYEAAAFKLKPGEVSAIVESKFGYHIIQMIERRGEKFNTRHILLRPQITDDDNIRVANFLDSIAALIKNDSMTFSEAAIKFSDDNETRFNGGKIVNPQSGSTRFETDQVEPSTFFQLDQLQPGQMTKVLTYTAADGKTGYRILMLLNRTVPHVANLKDDYQRLQGVASSEKETKALDEWIARKKGSTYFRMDDEFKNNSACAKWLNK